jgi:Ser/Thr protein kinase RdoA (MazF antagonist)
MLDPWRRIDFACTPDQLLGMVADDFNLGNIIDFEILTKGVIEVNFKVITVKGIFVVKVFSNKRLPRVKQIIQAQRILFSQDIPVPCVLSSIHGDFIFKIRSKTNKPFYGCVLEWCGGEDFTQREPGTMDLKRIAVTISQIHESNIQLVPIYDEWFPTNLTREYKLQRKYIQHAYDRAIQGIIEQYEKVDFNFLSRGFIHGDISREHVLIDTTDQQMCILDLGGINIDYQVVDLAFAMSYYCINLNFPSLSEFLERYHIMLEGYLSNKSLNDYEIRKIPIFIQGNYALCYLAGKYFLEKYEDENANKLVNFGSLGLNFSIDSQITSIVSPD